MPSSVFTAKYARFCQLLIQKREEEGMTQTDVARELGRPQSFVSKYERGERRLDLIEFLDIAVVLEIDPCIFIAKLQATDPHEH